MNTPIRKTKIVCTMGPNLFEKHLIAPLIKAGRMSHASIFRTALMKRISIITMKSAASAMNWGCRSPRCWTPGQGIPHQCVQFKNGRVTLRQPAIYPSRRRGGGVRARVHHYRNLRKDAVATSPVVAAVGMQVERIDGADIVCRVLNGGVVSNNKGVNIPNAHLSMPFISEKDHQDILFAIKNGYDFIAASFTRCADDIMQIRHILQENNCHTINIIAKIENMEGVENIDEILRVVDGVMVARGDLGVEVPLEDVPSLQKKLIQRGIAAGKPVITATQMLDSMIKNPRPTRAEATDVANAIYDGTSAIMLSGESAVGAYPVEAVETMVRIALRAEADMDYIRRFSRDTSASTDVTNAISHATVTSAHDLNASAIITVTKSGSTARILSRYRPACVIVGCTTEKHVWRQLALSWGTVPLMIAEESNTDDLFEHAVDAAVQNGLVHDGELVVLTAGVPLGISGTTNLMKVHVVGHLLSRGQGLHGGKVIAPLCVIRNLEKDAKDFNTGDVIVCHQTTREMFSMLRKSSAIVLEDDNPEGHGAIAGMSMDIPVIIGAKNATNILKSGAVVTVDGEKTWWSAS